MMKLLSYHKETNLVNLDIGYKIFLSKLIFQYQIF